MLAAVEQDDVAAPRSQATSAYTIIRADILAGRHTPDKKLKIQDLAGELRISPGAVREALSRLVPEQLVISRDQRGFAVAPLSIADLEDLTELRCDVEALALRRAVARGDVEWEARIIAAAHRLGARPYPNLDNDRRQVAAWVTSHADFHQALISACGSRRLSVLHAQLYEQSERYRGLTINYEGARDVGREHRRIVDLALARDANGLVAAMVDHIRRTTAVIIAAARPATAGVAPSDAPQPAG